MIIIKNGALVTPQGLRRADLAMDCLLYTSDAADEL